MTQLYVVYTEEEIDSYRAPENYGEWSSDNHFSVDGVFLNKPEHRGYTETFTTVFDVNVGDELHVLYIRYGTGDSFGHGSGYGEVIWVFKDLDVAMKAAKVWETTNNYRIDFEIEDGSFIKLSNPAHGYFEQLESVNVQTIIVQQDQCVV